MGNYLAYIIMGLLIAAGAFVTKAAYGQEWYLGEGLEKGLLVKYRISTFDYLQTGGSPFDATIWFGSQDDKGNWIADIIIEEQGKVVTSKMTLSAFDLTPLGLDYKEEFKPYKNAIRNSLGWIGDFANKDHPRPITGDTAWGRVSAVGGGVVKPMGTEKLQLADKEWDTSIIGFHYAVDSKIWIKDGFPLPIKAKVYTIATLQPLPVQFEFELLETSVSETPPPVPIQNIIPPTPPLHQQTTSGAISVDLYWKPESIEPSQAITISMVFFDRQQNLIKDAQYDILITDATGKVVLDKKQILTSEGQGTHEVTFDSTGSAHVTIIFLGTSSEMASITEKAEFNLVVVPEFPLGVVAVMAAIVAMMVAITRFKKISIRPSL